MNTGDAVASCVYRIAYHAINIKSKPAAMQGADKQNPPINSGLNAKSFYGKKEE